MHRHNQNSNYRNNSYLLPSTSTSSRNTYYQYYDLRLRAQQTPYSNIISSPTYESSNFHHQYQPSKSISDLTEPISVFDDLKPPRHHRSHTTIFPLAYLPPNLNRRSSVNDARLATASAMREQLLTDIQHNITEIDREITSLEQRYSSPQRFAPFVQSRQTPVHHATRVLKDKNPIGPSEHKRVYRVIPRITSESKKTSQQLTADKTSSQLLIGQFHYGAEIEENEIRDNDPENSKHQSVADEIPEFSSYKTFSLDELVHEQSDLSQNRALTLVPEYVDNNKIETNQLTEDMHQNNPIDTNTARSSTASSLHAFASSDKVNIQDFQSIIKTAPELKIQITSKNEGNPHKSTEKIEPRVINTILSKPVKHSHRSTKTRQTLSVSQQALSHSASNSTDDIGHFFSDYGNDGEVEEDVIPIDPKHFALPTESELISDDNTSVRQSEISLLNPRSSQQQLSIKNNNAHVKERKSKKIDATTKRIATTTTSTSASKKILPISTIDKTQTQFARNNNHNSNNDQRQILPTMSNMNLHEQSAENGLNNYSIYLHSSSWMLERKKSTKMPFENKNSNDQRPTSVNKEYDSMRQRSSSSRRSSKSQSLRIYSRDRSLTTADSNKTLTNQPEHVLDNKQQTPSESRRSSALPVPLKSPTFNNSPPPTSRVTTPERRNSTPSIDQDILLQSSNDIFNSNDPSIDYLPTASPQQTTSEREGPSPLACLDSFEKIQHDNQSDELKSELLSNQNQEEFVYHNTSPSISINIQENDQTKSNSLLASEIKNSEHEHLRLPSISSHHSDTSDANLTSVDREDTFRQPLSSDHKHNQLEAEPKHEEELPLITASQRRSKLSLLLRQPKPKQKKSLNDQSSQTHLVDSSLKINNEKSEQHRRVFFSNDIASFQVETDQPLPSWRERIDTLLSKQRFPASKYSHIKSRVNTFDNFDYRPRKFMIASKKKPRTKISSNQQNKTKAKKLKKPIPSGTEMFGRIWREPDGTPKIFHESLEWKSKSKVKSYSLENLHYKSRPKHSKTLHKKLEWHSEPKLIESTKNTSRRENLTHTVSLPIILDNDEQQNFHHQQSDSQMKIFDINSSSQQTLSKFQESVFDSASFVSRRSDKVIFDEKLLWAKKSKLKDSTWENIKYQPKKSQVQIFHKPVHWNRRSSSQKALLSQTYDPKWDDIINYPIEENPTDKLLEESPANRPKWNSVSKTRSVNTVYNPKMPHSDLIRRGWDLELRRKRVHKLPPLKRKRDHDDIQRLAVEAPPSNELLAIDYSYEQSDIMHELMTSVDYATISSRRSSKALVPLRRVPDLQLVSETPRSQRPVQQEWYDELTKSRSTHRMDMGRITNSSLRDLNGSIHQTNTPRELRSSTRNSQTSFVSGTLLDSSIRTNRATELRLSKDMNEHHQHSHDPSQSMPIEIRGFRLEGTQLTVPNNATIRPLSNVSYRTSERVKSRRIYPWSNMHPYGTSSRNSSLVPIAELRHPSFETSLIAVPQLVNEE